MGTARYLNFFGLFTPKHQRWLHSTLESKQVLEANHTFLLSHYPFSNIRSRPMFFDASPLKHILSNRVSVYLCGHLHKLAFGLGKFLQLYHTDENFMELELADLKTTAIFRVIVVDHDLISYRDWPLFLPAEHAIHNKTLNYSQILAAVNSRAIITNPKDARQMLAREPWWRIKQSSHVRVLVWTTFPDEEVFVTAAVDGVSMDWEFSKTSTNRHPLWTGAWEPQQFDDGHHHHLTVYIKHRSTDEILTSDNVVFRLDGEREDFHDWVWTTMVNIDFTTLFTGGVIFIYIIWLFGMLLIPKLIVLLYHSEKSAVGLEKHNQMYRNEPSPSNRSSYVKLFVYFGSNLIRTAESRLWWTYFILLLVYITLPWYKTDLLGDQMNETQGYVYLVGFWVAGCWQPVLDTWASAFLDLWCWRFPVFLYLVFRMSCQQDDKHFKMEYWLHLFVRLGVMVMWWIQWRVIFQTGVQVLWTGAGNMLWGVCETYWLWWVDQLKEEKKKGKMD